MAAAELSMFNGLAPSSILLFSPVAVVRLIAGTLNVALGEAGLYCGSDFFWPVNGNAKRVLNFGLISRVSATISFSETLYRVELEVGEVVEVVVVEDGELETNRLLVRIGMILVSIISGRVSALKRDECCFELNGRNEARGSGHSQDVCVMSSFWRAKWANRGEGMALSREGYF